MMKKEIRRIGLDVELLISAVISLDKTITRLEEAVKRLPL